MEGFPEHEATPNSGSADWCQTEYGTEVSPALCYMQWIDGGDVCQDIARDNRVPKADNIG